MRFDKRLFENVFELQENIGYIDINLGRGAHGVVYKCKELKS
jgi:hypothetical protein